MIGKENNFEAAYSSGISRDTRMPSALLPENIPIDERGLEDDLVFAGSLSNYVNFYNAQNEPAGTWHPFFGKSEPALLAAIASTDLEKIKNEFDECVVLFEITKRRKRKIEELDHIFDLTLGIALRINHWHKHLSRGKSNSVLREIESLIEGGLNKGLAALKQIDDASAAIVEAELGHPFNGDYTMFGEKWHMEPLQNESVDASGLRIGVLLLDLIQGIFKDFFHVLSQIVQNTKHNLEKVIAEENDNRPDISLYIAFTRMMKSLRGQMNTITGRHMDFYYFDVLKHKRLSFEPDRTLVRFVLQENTKELMLPAGTELVAGKDDTGKELIYTTDKNISINKARIISLYTLFVSRNPDVITGVENEDLRMVKGIYSSTNPSTTVNGTALDWWPLMGCDQLDVASSQTTMKEAELGFSIASPALFLSEGQRDVTVTFSLDKTEARLANLRRIIHEIEENESRNNSSAVFYLFSKALSISITSAEGWKNIERYAFMYDEKNAELILRFSFTQADPAVIGFDPALHGEGFDTQWPVLRMMLNTYNAPVYAYSLLSDMLVNRIRIRTDVKGMRKLSLYNSQGKLSIEKPFQPFGALPVPGSFLLVGSSEAMNKNIQSLQLQFSWHDLPPEGFAEYYKGYPGEITNASFTAGISLLQKGYFLPLRDEQQRVQLFYDAPTDHPERGIPVYPETVIDKINVPALRHRASWSIPKQQLVFGPETPDGFLKLELLTPPVGFGSAEYAPLLSSAILANSKTKKPQQLPRVPYTPVVGSISLDYSAEFDSDVSPGEGVLPIGIFRHHPFGMDRVAIASSFRNIPLFQKLDNEGYLFIGISGLELPQPLTVFFKLSDESFYSHEEPGTIEWSYLSANTWKPFRNDRVLCDGTNKFVQPGIIELDLPGEMTNDNTIMPSGLYWICVSVKERTHCISYAKTLDTQAVTVTWKHAGNSFTHLDSPLPPGSITKTKQKIQQIKEVVQPLASTDGRKPEEKNEAYTRLSERLGHRNRALLPADYERLVLQHFPTVYKAQCFPDMNSEQQHKHGNVLVVVMPDVDRRKDINTFRPKDSFSLLQKIANFLKEHAPPFATIEVRNPLYERVKVIASVKFKSGLDSGFYLRQLNQDMRAFLSPWIYNSHEEVKLGGSISHASVMGFIERQSYISFVTSLSIVVTKDHNGFFLLEDTARMREDDRMGEDPAATHVGKRWFEDITRIKKTIHKDIDPGLLHTDKRWHEDTIRLNSNHHKDKDPGALHLDQYWSFEGNRMKSEAIRKGDATTLHAGKRWSHDEERSKDAHHKDEGTETLYAGKPWSLLVTASRHLFTAIDEEKMTDAVPRGIGNLVIEDNFIITQ